MHPDVTAFFDEATNTATFVVRDPGSKSCAVIDSVLDLDYAAGLISTRSAEGVIAHNRDHGLEVDWIL